MEPLNISRININAPYKVWNEDQSYRFETDNGISYVVDFDSDDNPYFRCYWFNLTNPRHAKSPGDLKIAQTVVCIIEEFFHQNPDVLLYMCSTDNGQQAMRNRLFLRWFTGAEQSKRFFFKSEMVIDEGMENFIAIIVPRSHPYLDDIIKHFDSEIAMFRANKPQ